MEWDDLFESPDTTIPIKIKVGIEGWVNVTKTFRPGEPIIGGAERFSVRADIHFPLIDILPKTLRIFLTP